VYGISQHISNSELQSEFEKFGTVTDTYNTGKGYAFVTYDCPEEATDATRKMDGSTIFGQQIKVNVARPKNNDGGGGSGGYRSGGGFGGGRGDYQQSRGRGGRGRGGGRGGRYNNGGDWGGGHYRDNGGY